MSELKFVSEWIYEQTDMPYDPRLCAVCGHEDWPPMGTHAEIHTQEEDFELCLECWDKAKKELGL